MKLISLTAQCTLTVLTHWDSPNIQWDFSELHLGAPTTYTLPSGELTTLTLRGTPCKGYVELPTETLIYTIKGQTLHLCDPYQCQTYEPLNEEK